MLKMAWIGVYIKIVKLEILHNFHLKQVFIPLIVLEIERDEWESIVVYIVTHGQQWNTTNSLIYIVHSLLKILLLRNFYF